MGDDVATAGYVPADVAEWQRLSAGAVSVVGFDLAKGEDLDALVGWEMICTSATFRPGIVRDIISGGKKVKKQFAYVSVETMLAPVQNMKRINLARRSSGLTPVQGMDEFPFQPSDHVVINDGSTGIYRQIMAYLVDIGSITLNVSGDDIKIGGEMGESSYDVPPPDWQSWKSDASERADDWSEYAIEFGMLIRCPRGIRRSEYDNPAGPDKSVTRYLG
jgi:hypothetical protein